MSIDIPIKILQKKPRPVMHEMRHVFIGFALKNSRPTEIYKYFVDEGYDCTIDQVQYYRKKYPITDEELDEARKNLGRE